MVTFFRIDERLIHGQIAIKWSKHTGVSHIVVANNAAALNPLIQKSLMMAAPADVKTAIKSIDDSIVLLNDPRAVSMKIMVLVNNPRDAVSIIEKVKDIPFINVGNYGRIAPDVPGKPRKAYGRNIYCNEMEVEEFHKLVATGLKCIYQTTPEEAAEDVSRIFR
jgi:PTS system mannose-specific IIB component